MDNIQISIIMPAYNASKYIRPAIESVLVQTYENWQLVIIDDGSTDDTLQIAQEYATLDEKKRIVVVHQENSGTAAAARNTALEYVTGDYVQILDSDDYLSTDCLQKYVDILQREDESPTIILPIALSVHDDGHVLREISHASEYVRQVLSGDEAFELSLDWIVHGWMCVCATLLKKVKFDPLLINGDEFTTRKLFANAQRVIVSDGIYYYRDNQESTTKSNKNRYRMHETLITDANIYDYSVTRGMTQELISKCAKKWMKAIVAHEAQYLRNKDEYTITQRKYVTQIIENNLEKATNDKIYKYDSSIWGRLVGLCHGNVLRLQFIARCYNIVWNIKNKIKRK